MTAVSSHRKPEPADISHGSNEMQISSPLPKVLFIVTSLFCLLLLQDFAYCYYRILLLLLDYFLIATVVFCLLGLYYFVYCYNSICLLPLERFNTSAKGEEMQILST